MLASLLLAMTLGTVDAQPPLVLAVGVNDPHLAGTTPLRYADDDAANAAALFGDADRTWLLTLFDVQSQGDFPGWARRAHAPTTAELTRSVAEIRARLEALRAAGESPEVVVWLVGHGSYDDEGHPFFGLSDGRLSSSELMEKVIAPLTIAHRVHVIVDTCHAEALVQSRASVRAVDPRAAEAAWVRTGLKPYPNVGVLLASKAGSESFEWDEIHSGVVSALLRSALRGAADADGDGEVSYQETAAFVSAASEGVPLRRARPSLLTAPPEVDPGAILSRASWFTQAVTVQGDLSGLGAFQIESERGAWILAARFEPRHRVRLRLPPGRLLLRSGDAERPLQTSPDGELELGPQLSNTTSARGSMARALREGLFSVEYGPSYFRGFAAATKRELFEPTTPATHARPSPGARRVLSVGAFVGAALAGGGAIASGAVSVDALNRYQQTELERPAALARAQGEAARNTSFALVGGALVLGVVGYLLH